MRRSTIGTVGVALAALLALACGAGADDGAGTSTGTGDTPASAPAGNAPAKNAPVTVAAGQPMTLTEELFGNKTVVVITLTNVKAGVKSGNQFIKPSKGQFITADVTAEVREGKHTINSSMFKLVGADGTAYDTTTMLDRKDISGSDLTPGQKASGSVVFDAAVGAEKGGKIALKSWLADGDAGYWQLP